MSARVALICVASIVFVGLMYASGATRLELAVIGLVAWTVAVAGWSRADRMERRLDGLRSALRERLTR
ncbi:MAG TPA: hypothetical protein VLE97_00095 [Gaiellaceae bacterium]|nr:hypothetical protein [Gaiellaceae bacterium]